MTFELTKDLARDIAEALENQEENFTLDAKNMQLVSGNIKADDNRYYSLPAWQSKDGFAVMQDFVSILQRGEVRHKLESVLYSGQGVFRNFKEVIKRYSTEARMYRIYKQKRLKSVINTWYNNLCYMWGLEGTSVIADYDDLLEEDFNFSPYGECDFAQNKENILTEIENKDIRKSALELLTHCFDYSVKNKRGLSCICPTGQEAGYICVCPSFTVNTVFLLTDLYVDTRFRRLGIASALLAKCMEHLAYDNVQYLFIANVCLPKFLLPLLTRMGFEKQALVGYVASTK